MFWMLFLKALGVIAVIVLIGEGFFWAYHANHPIDDGDDYDYGG